MRMSVELSMVEIGSDTHDLSKGGDGTSLARGRRGAHPFSER